MLKLPSSLLSHIKCLLGGNYESSLEYTRSSTKLMVLFFFNEKILFNTIHSIFPNKLQNLQLNIWAFCASSRKLTGNFPNSPIKITCIMCTFNTNTTQWYSSHEARLTQLDVYDHFVTVNPLSLGTRFTCLFVAASFPENKNE